MQTALLRVLEDRRVRPLGSERERAIDVRIITASNRDLAAEVAAGRFRADLYYRLNVLALRLPPLRERLADLAPLAQHFAQQLAGELGLPAPLLDAAALAALAAHDWPGNVRELRNVVERSAYLSPDGVIDLITAGTLPRSGRDQPVVFDPTLTFREQKERAVELFEETYLNWLLQRSEGNISRAAREADMDRKYLHKLLRRYGIDAKQFTAAALGNRANADASSGDASA